MVDRGRQQVDDFPRYSLQKYEHRGADERQVVEPDAHRDPEAHCQEQRRKCFRVVPGWGRLQGRETSKRTNTAAMGRAIAMTHPPWSGEIERTLSAELAPLRGGDGILDGV